MNKLIKTTNALENLITIYNVLVTKVIFINVFMIIMKSSVKNLAGKNTYNKKQTLYFRYIQQIDVI